MTAFILKQAFGAGLNVLSETMMTLLFDTSKRYQEGQMYISYV